MAWLILIGFALLVILANFLLGALTGFMFSPGVIVAAIIGGCGAIVTVKIKNKQAKEEAEYKEYYKQLERQKNEEEEFQKLPAWKRVELMKQQENQEQKEQD